MAKLTEESRVTENEVEPLRKLRHRRRNRHSYVLGASGLVKGTEAIELMAGPSPTGVRHSFGD
jgi:hypothetical protein